jgi:hypothetical protein
MRRPDIDRLALLCTLHADGPRSLRQLREAGCHSLEALGAMETDNIGDVLRLPPAAARRFSREASRLQDRLEPDLDREEVTYPPASGQRAAGYGAPEFSSPRDPDTDVVSRLDVRDRELLDRVVHSWRPVEYVDRPEKPSRVEESAETPAPQVVLEPESEPTLQPGDVEGLDSDLCASLAQVGIRTLEDLVNCSVDELVTRAGLPFTRARTLQFRAGKRRVVASHSPVDPAPFTPVEIQSAPPEIEPPVPAPVMSEPRAPSCEVEEEEGPEFPEEPIYEIVRPFYPQDDSGAAGPFA